jgi:hypothetical protein
LSIEKVSVLDLVSLIGFVRLNGLVSSFGRSIDGEIGGVVVTDDLNAFADVARNDATTTNNNNVFEAFGDNGVIFLNCCIGTFQNRSNFFGFGL